MKVMCLGLASIAAFGAEASLADRTSVAPTCASEAASMLQMKPPLDSAETPSHEGLLEHLAGTPFLPGVMHHHIAKHLELLQGSNLSVPDYDTVTETWMPWEDGVQPLVQCSDNAGAIREEADVNLQKALSIFCKAGLGSLAEFYVDARFRGNYERLRGSDGWIPKAYLTYMGLHHQHDNTSGEEDLLIQSVHHFSDYPVVLTNFGTRVPRHMTPLRFPNLVLMHARASATSVHRGFNLNKFVSMLFTKVRGGVVLDADQWVNRGVDVMLERAFEETTKDYPIPVMPVHWMTRDPESDDMAHFPPAYTFHFKSKDAPKRSMRWGHSHPTWTHYALPWLAKWTSYELAPKATRAPAWLTAQGPVSDEPLMNFALWADGLTKQWCKFDIPTVGDFGTYLTQTTRRVKIDADSKFFPRGIPFVFFTAHDAKRPDQSYEWLTKLWETGDDKRKAILYDGKWFGSGRAMMSYDPTLRCIV